MKNLLNNFFKKQQKQETLLEKWTDELQKEIENLKQRANKDKFVSDTFFVYVVYSFIENNFQFDDFHTGEAYLVIFYYLKNILNLNKDYIKNIRIFKTNKEVEQRKFNYLENQYYLFINTKKQFLDIIADIKEKDLINVIITYIVQNYPDFFYDKEETKLLEAISVIIAKFIKDKKALISLFDKVEEFELREKLFVLLISSFIWVEKMFDNQQERFNQLKQVVLDDRQILLQELYDKKEKDLTNNE